MTTHPSELAMLLVDLGRAGVHLAIHPTDPARLRFRAATIAPDLREALGEHRAALLKLLSAGHEPGTSAGWLAYAERLEAAYDAGIPTGIGCPGWLWAIGESMGNSCSQTTTMVESGDGKTRGCDPAGG